MDQLRHLQKFDFNAQQDIGRKYKRYKGSQRLVLQFYKMEARNMLSCFNQAFQDNKETPPILIARSCIFSN